MDQGDQSRDLLLADLDHFGESFLRNEEVGEKRIEYFVTITTAVIGGLAALHQADQVAYEAIVHFVLAGLLLLGILTYLRMLHRNRVTSQYHRTMAMIRRKLVQARPVEGGYNVPLPLMQGVWKWFHGGLAETTGAFVGIIVFAWIYIGTHSAWVAAPEALAVTSALWLLAGSARNASGPEEYFRAGAGAVILNSEGKVLTLERRDAPDSWQLPQGGLDAGETPLKAVIREIKEETGIQLQERDLEPFDAPLVYELPVEYRKSKTGRGQVNYWFRARYAGPEPDLAASLEFRCYRWLTPDELLAAAPEFRKRVYRTLMDWIT